MALMKNIFICTRLLDQVIGAKVFGEYLLDVLKAFNALSMEYSQGLSLSLNYGATLKCHFYDLTVLR